MGSALKSPIIKQSFLKACIHIVIIIWHFEKLVNYFRLSCSNYSEKKKNEKIISYFCQKADVGKKSNPIVN